MKNMKYLNLLKLQCMALLMLGGLFISSCTEDDMTVGTVDEKLYEFHDDLLGYLTDSQGKQLASNVEFRSSGDLLLYLNLTKKRHRIVLCRLFMTKACLKTIMSETLLRMNCFPNHK